MSPFFKIIVLTYLLLSGNPKKNYLNISKIFTGKVIKIVDGDTFDVLNSENETIRIRMNGIDCPEKKQDYFRVCKNALSTFIAGKIVEIRSTGKDRYRRVLADVYLENKSINLLMIQKGFAWHYKKYSNNTQMARAEIEARQQKIGLWKNENTIAPWIFRQRKTQKLLDAIDTSKKSITHY